MMRSDSFDSPPPVPPDSGDDAFERAVASAARGAVTVSAAETDAGWRALAARIDGAADTAVVPIAAITGRGGRNWRRAASLAAVAVLAVTVGTLWRQRSPAFDTVIAPAGQRVAVQLPDGTNLTLAAGSRARWRRGFSGGNRDVVLDGEGYFDVVHDERTPFRVYASHARIEDVGTRFLVRAWPEQAGVDVSVTEGEVALTDTASVRRGGSAPAQHLRAGQRGVLRPDGAVQVSTTDSAALGWLSGALYFDDAPLREALPLLGRWYAVRIEADSALHERRLSGRFVQQPLPQLLQALGMALNVRIEQRADVIRLHAKD